MTDDEMRMAIAEWRGAKWMLAPAHPARPDKRNRFLCFTAFYNLDGSCGLEEANGDERLTSLEYMWREGFIPDYPTDLNAVHETEIGLTEDEHKQFRNHLAVLTTQSDGDERPEYYSSSNERAYISSTAHQRLEALLKTLGLWKPKSSALIT